MSVFKGKPLLPSPTVKTGAQGSTRHGGGKIISSSLSSMGISPVKVRSVGDMSGKRSISMSFPSRGSNIISSPSSSGN